MKPDSPTVRKPVLSPGDRIELFFVRAGVPYCKTLTLNRANLVEFPHQVAHIMNIMSNDQVAHIMNIMSNDQVAHIVNIMSNDLYRDIAADLAEEEQA